MIAAVLREVGKPLVVESVPVPEVSPDEVLVETKFCGICGTDLHIVDGFGYVPKLPHIPGHEPSGVVAKVGSDVKSFKPGDRVVPYLFITCGECWYCKSGRDSMCSNLKGIIGVISDGAFAQYFKAPARNLFRLPDSVSFEVGALTADAVITSVHAVYDRGNVHSMRSAAVIGVGGVGQVIVQLLKDLGLSVIAVSRSEAKLSVARSLGADHVWKSGGEDLEEQSRRYFADGVDVVFDCVGSKDSMTDALGMVRRCGRVVMVGEEEALLPATSTQIAQRELEIVGSRNGSRSNMELGLQFLSRGVIKPLISDIFPLEKINEAFERVRNGASGRVVVKVG
ncbi:MAG: alcohol dehydrogenase catalytic domain-containing protein [Thaumarchaeota archaeon]|nr:alcohol dehydrogenase catalytic domain-containing protein [Nitrososphaerota archaeon]